MLLLGIGDCVRLVPNDYNQLRKGRMEQRIMRRPEVLETVGIAVSTLYDWVASGRFPRPIRLGPKAVGWRVTDIDQWLAERPLVEATKKGD